MSINIRRLDSQHPEFSQQLKGLLDRDTMVDAKLKQRVSTILEDIKQKGDVALIGYVQTLDQYADASIKHIEISTQSMREAYDGLTETSRLALEQAVKRIEKYHQYQVKNQSSWQYEETDGTVLGQQVKPIERVGIYVPGGKASYPSSVLMNAIPAKVAGVNEIIMCVPAPQGYCNPIVLAAAYLAGVDRVFTIGGAQAIGAMAYGTQTVPKVDKIVGPGNVYVAVAKSLVFGVCGIDMMAGPSEILIVCDGKTDPDWIAADLFSQAEHDEQAQAILLCEQEDYLNQVQASINKLIDTLPRKDIIRTSLEQKGALIQVTNIEEAITIANRIAPEHLELSVDNAEQWLPFITHAGAVFLGRYTPEALGDYCAGPSHVLPTSGTARFSSPLGVTDFQKRTSLIHCSMEGAHKLSKIASELAQKEGLQAHAMSADFRINAT